MEKTKTSCDNVVTEKIKAFDPHIVVNKADSEPYYMIQYYDVSDKKWHLGYGSFYLSFVREWLRDEFEEVEIEFAEVKHGKWKEHFAFGVWHYDCPFCGDGYATKERDKTPPNYCQNCGAKMDGGKAE